MEQSQQPNHNRKGLVVSGAIIVLLCVMLTAWTPVEAQTPETIITDIDRASITWDIVPPADGVSWAEQYALTCHSPSQPSPVLATVAHPANTIALRGVLPGVGTYTCTVRAENHVGASAESNAVSFGVGGPPGVVNNVRIEVR